MSYENLTMDDFSAELEASFKKIEEGDMLTGTVISVDEKEVILDLKYYAEGVIRAEDFSNEPGFSLKDAVQVGDEITATVIRKDDGHGNILEETVTETKTTLHIVVSHKTATEMAAEYGFGERQLEHLDALLEEGTSGMWAAVLYGVYGADDQIVQVALTQVGNVGGEPYWSWYGFGSRVEWCACFVSWCAD